MLQFKMPQPSLIQTTFVLTQRQKLSLCVFLFLKMLAVPSAYVSWYTARLFSQRGSDVPSLLRSLYSFVNCAAGCFELEVPSIQQRGTSISLSKVEFPHSVLKNRKKKPLLDPLQLWRITALHCLSPLNQSPALLYSALNRSSIHTNSTNENTVKRWQTSYMGRIIVPPLTRRLVLYLHSNFAN